MRPADFSRERESTTRGTPIEQAGEAQSAAVERGCGEGVEQVFLVGIEASGEPIRQEEGSEEFGADGQPLRAPTDGLGEHVATCGRGTVGLVKREVKGGAERPNGVDGTGDLGAEPMSDDGAKGDLMSANGIAFSALATETDVSRDDLAWIGPIYSQGVFAAGGGEADAGLHPGEAEEVGMTREQPAWGGCEGEAEVEPLFVSDAGGAREGRGKEGVVAGRIVAVEQGGDDLGAGRPLQGGERGRGAGNAGECRLTEELQAVVLEHVVETKVDVAAAAEVVVVVERGRRIDALPAKVVGQGRESDVHARAGIAQVAADGTQADRVSAAAFVTGTVQAVDLEGGDGGAVCRGVHLATRSEEAQLPVGEGKGGSKTAEELLFVGGIMAAEAVVAVFGLGSECATGGRIVMTYDEPLPKGGLEVAHGKGAQVPEIFQDEVSRIVVVALMSRISKGLSGIFFSREASLQSVVKGVGVSDGVAEGLAEVSPGAAVRSRGVAALSFHSLVVFHDPFAGAVVQQISKGNIWAFGAVSVYANEGGDASECDPVEDVDGSQFVDGEEVVVPLAVGEDGVDLCVGEERKLVKVVGGGCVEVDRMLSQVGEVGVECFKSLFVKLIVSVFGKFTQLFHPIVRRMGVLRPDDVACHNE